MACGRPVVVMRAGALPELVDPGAGALAEPHADPCVAAGNLAEAIVSVYERDLDTLGAAARRHVLANYSWSRALQSLMARYQAAVSARRLPALTSALGEAETTH
jgi:alpha-1,6-mannosyltransferase